VTVTERVCVSTLIGCVGLIFKRQQKDSAYGKFVRVIERFLRFYCYWLCTAHKAVGFLV
jgi:hypothetical protein